MKLSSNTTMILKNFATINQNLVIKEGSELLTMSSMKNIVAKATVEENFPKEIAIYDLNEFLAALSLFESPELDFEDDHVMISNEGKTSSCKYWYSDPSVVTTVSNPIDMPESEVSFTLSSDELSNITKAAAVIGVPDMVLENGSLPVSYTHLTLPTNREV